MSCCNIDETFVDFSVDSCNNLLYHDLKHGALGKSVNLMTKLVHRKKKGRPAGAETRYPNILRFCRLHGYAPQHVRACLDGQRPYADRVKTRWEQFVAAGR